MKLYFRNISLAVLAIAAASFVITSCDFLDKVSDITIPTEFESTYNLSVSESSPTSIPFNFSKTVAITDNQEVAQYAEKIKELTIESISFKVIDYVDNGGDDVIFSNGEINVGTSTPVTISFPEEVNLATSSGDTQLQISDSNLVKIASMLKNEKSVTMNTDGILSHTPVNCKIVFTYKVKVVAETID